MKEIPENELHDAMKEYLKSIESYYDIVLLRKECRYDDALELLSNISDKKNGLYVRDLARTHIYNGNCDIALREFEMAVGDRYHYQDATTFYHAFSKNIVKMIHFSRERMIMEICIVKQLKLLILYYHSLIYHSKLEFV